MPKWQKLKCDILGDFQTLWISIFSAKIRTMLAFNVLKSFQVRILKAKVRNESLCACASCQIQVMHYTSLFVRITKEGLSPKSKHPSLLLSQLHHLHEKLSSYVNAVFAQVLFSLDDTTVWWPHVSNETAVATQKALKSPEWRHNSTKSWLALA